MNRLFPILFTLPASLTLFLSLRLPAAELWLDQLDVSLSSCGWHRTRANQSVQGNPLRIGTTTYEHGIGTHAPGEFRVKLHKKALSFSALVGIDAESGPGGSVEFIVKADKKVLWKSGVMRGGEGPKKVKVDLRGFQDLRLIVTVGGDNYNNDHTDWGNAKIVYNGTPPVAAKASDYVNGIEFPDVAGVEALAAGPTAVKEDWEKQYSETARLSPGHYRFPDGQVFNQHAMVLESDHGPLTVAIRRLEALLEKVRATNDAPDLTPIKQQLAAIKSDLPDDASQQKLLYMKVRELTRETAFANPLLDFDDILFIARGVLNDHRRQKSEYDGDHFCDQYYGHNGRTGGGLFIIRNFKSGDPELVDVTGGLKVPEGTNKGMLLNKGTFISPDLSWDGNTIAFGWSSGNHSKWDPAGRFSLFKVNVDGSGLRRLTDGPFDDFDPCWLPNGRIVFVSTRRHGYGRCHGRPVPAFTMCSIKPDGSDMIKIDYHETNEFHPSVDNAGRLVYTRWDYVDRDHSAAHHMWHCYADGRDPRSLHANYALPLTTVEGGNSPNGLHLRPWAEFNCRAIPGHHNLYIATAGPHHGQAFGSLVLINAELPDDHAMSQVKRITPHVRFPEAETGTRNWSDMAFGTAWPLDRDFYLCNHKEGICILDAMGNRELICASRIGMRLLDPIPLRSRNKPPEIPAGTFEGERKQIKHHPATICVMNVYITDSFGKLPEGAEINELRVVQVLPKSTPHANSPRIGFGDQSLARIPLGTVPVEKDGSVYFKAPVEKAIYFQLLNEQGMAVQSMRSVTYIHPGEQMSCLGCHESKDASPPVTAMPLALKRPPSELKPELPDQIMFNFHRHIKPIFERKCVTCHRGTENAGPADMSYNSLRDYLFFFGHGYRNHLHGGSRVKPGSFGALFSKIGKALLDPRHQKRMKEGRFTRQDFRTICMWLDLNSNELSAYRNVAAQKRGEIVWPEYDVDPDNYTGIERIRKIARK